MIYVVANRILLLLLDLLSQMSIVVRVMIHNTAIKVVYSFQRAANQRCLWKGTGSDRGPESAMFDPNDVENNHGKRIESRYLTYIRFSRYSQEKQQLSLVLKHAGASEKSSHNVKILTDNLTIQGRKWLKRPLKNHHKV